VFANVAVNQLGPFIRRMRELSLPQKVMGNVWVMSSSFVAAAGLPASEGVVFAQVDTDKPRFLEALRQYRPQAVPSAATYCCFAALSALLQSLGKIPAEIDSRSAYEALNKLDEIRLPDETLQMKEREAVFDLVLKTFKDGKALKLSPGRVDG